MRKIIILFIFLQGLAGNLFSQTITNSRNNSSFPVNVANCTGTTHKTESEVSFFYSLGGHLFAGDYPINNPVSTGDTGIIFLYRLNNNIIIPTDTLQFSNLGYFVFFQLLEGEYILKASLTSNSTNYKNYFPTYFTSTLRWNSSNHLELIDSSYFEANIRLLPTVTTLLGTSSIKGYVVQSSSEQGFQKVKNAEVLLFNDKMDPLTFCFSDNTGRFSFSNLAFGTYHLMVESVGRFPALLSITLDQNHTAFDSLQLELLTHYPSTVEELGNHPGTIVSNVFPNPAENNINIVLRTTEPENLNFAIYSLNGKKVISDDYLITGVRSLNIPLGSLSKGIYFLMVSTPNGRWTEVQKFFKL
jgi:Secretion system C-terminal sorting domain